MICKKISFFARRVQGGDPSLAAAGRDDNSFFYHIAVATVLWVDIVFFTRRVRGSYQFRVLSSEY